jgi:hypothetical protein
MNMKPLLLPKTWFVATALVAFTSAGLARTITVDPKTPGACRTLAEAASQLRAGDTLQIAAGTGPYREPLYIRASGTPEAPIVIEGNGNEITGFDPLVFSPLPDGRLAATVPTEYPFVLRHAGRRVKEDAQTNQFEGGVTYERAENRLVLAPGVSAEGWEISVRQFAVRISNASYHVYRDIDATGSRNDGFNLHGDGRGLVFEAVSGRQNLDEGFSSHGTMECEIRNARFSENDNGILNGQQTVTRLENVDVFDNVGFGIGFNGEARIDAVNVRSWGNGVSQLLLRAGVKPRFESVRIYRNANTSRRWLSYMESARWPRLTTMSVDRDVVWEGEPLTPLSLTAPADVSAR